MKNESYANGIECINSEGRKFREVPKYYSMEMAERTAKIHNNEKFGGFKSHGMVCSN